MQEEIVALAEALHRGAIRLLRHLRREDDASGLTAPRLSALSVLVFRGPQTPAELASAEQVRRPTMTRLVQALEAEGLVRRTAHPGDARSVVLEATAEGRAVLEAGRRRRVARLARGLARLPKEKRAVLEEAARVMALLGEEGAPEATSPPAGSTPRASGAGPRPRRARRRR